MRNTVAAPQGAVARAPTGDAGAPARPALGEHALQLAFIMGGALLLRLAWIAYSGWRLVPGDDSFRYDFMARALVAGQGYIHVNGEPSAFWPPGYSLLLAVAYRVFSESVSVAQLLNALLGTATVGLVYLIGRRTVGARPALLAAGIVAAFPSLVFFTAVTLSETTFTFVLLLAVYLVLREAESERRDLRLLLATGLVLGYASLVRGQALLLPLVLVPFWLRSGFARPAIADKVVALALGIMLVVAPWTLRNAAELGSPVLISTNAGVDFWIGHHEGATGRGQYADELIYARTELNTPEHEVWVNAEGFRRGLSFALTHPGEELLLVPKKLFWLYSHDSEGLLWNEAHGGQPFLTAGEEFLLLGVSNGYYYVVMGLFAFGVLRWFSWREPGRLLLVSLVAYWTLAHVVFFGDPRFHAPIVPVIALLAAVPLAALRSGEEEPGGLNARGVPLKLANASDIIRMSSDADTTG